MQLAVSTGLQSHVDPGQGGRDRELADLETLAAHGCREIAEDAATGTVGDRLSRLPVRERQQLAEIDAAQARIEVGCFGVCERCQTLIPVQRLRAMATTRYCPPCRDRIELGS